MKKAKRIWPQNEVKIGDCVDGNTTELLGYLGRITSIEKGVAKVRMHKTGNLHTFFVTHLHPSH